MSCARQRTVCPSMPNTVRVRKGCVMLFVRGNTRPLSSLSSWSYVPLCGRGFRLWSTHRAGAQRGHPLLLPCAGVKGCEHVLCEDRLMHGQQA